jgi:hypothetical protein
LAWRGFQAPFVVQSFLSDGVEFFGFHIAYIDGLYANSYGFDALLDFETQIFN